MFTSQSVQRHITARAVASHTAHASTPTSSAGGFVPRNQAFHTSVPVPQHKKGPPTLPSPAPHSTSTAAQLLAVSYANSCTATARPEGSSLPAQAASHSAAVAVLHATDGPPAQQHTQHSTAHQSVGVDAQPPVCLTQHACLPTAAHPSISSGAYACP